MLCDANEVIFDPVFSINLMFKLIGIVIESNDSRTQFEMEILKNH